jgi:hypothetical protein
MDSVCVCRCEIVKYNRDCKNIAADDDRTILKKVLVDDAPLHPRNYLCY